MENKVDESKIIDYIYGNLPAKEMRRVEDAMANDPKLRLEIEDLKKVMNFIGNTEDKEVIPPSFIFPAEKNENTTFFSSNYFKLIASIAASLLLLLLSAYVTGFNIYRTSAGLSIGFYHSSESQAVSREEVKDIMQEVLNQYNQDRDHKLSVLEAKLSTQLMKSKEDDNNAIKKYLESNSEESLAMMKQFADQSNSLNRQMIADFFQVSTDQQQEYLKTVLTNFTQHYNSQRKADLETIRTGLLDYKDTNDQKQYETELVLANLVDIVNTQNK